MYIALLSRAYQWPAHAERFELLIVILSHLFCFVVIWELIDFFFLCVCDLCIPRDVAHWQEIVNVCGQTFISGAVYALNAHYNQCLLAYKFYLNVFVFYNKLPDLQFSQFSQFTGQVMDVCLFRLIF